MYPNLLGQKELHKLSNARMASIIGISRNAYDQKIASGRFTIDECDTYARFFNKSVAYLFASDDTLPKYETGAA